MKSSCLSAGALFWSVAVLGKYHLSPTGSVSYQPRDDTQQPVGMSISKDKDPSKGHHGQLRDTEASLGAPELNVGSPTGLKSSIPRTKNSSGHRC